MWKWIACYVNGHEYSVTCQSGSMFLRCLQCGRRSQGWTVHSHDGQSEPEADTHRQTVSRVRRVPAINMNA